MITITLDNATPDEAADAALAVLREGGIIAYPTETFYGLGAKFNVPRSLKLLYDLKKRPREKAMPVIIGDRELLPEIASRDWLAAVPLTAQALIERFWPGPLTLLLPAREGLSEFLTAGTGVIAVRVPGESFALRLAKKAGFPFTATSANLSGMPPAASAPETTRYFGEGISLLVDAGKAPGGLPSTIVDASGASVRIVREGAITRREIEDFLERARTRGKKRE